ncbi:MAG: hypothetical protein ACFE9Z_10860 [Promethearchaeota archaeon]
MKDKKNTGKVLKILIFIIGVLYSGFSLFCLYFLIIGRNYPYVPSFIISLLSSFLFPSISVFFGYTAPIGIAMMMYPLNPKFRGIPLAIYSCIALFMSFFISYSYAIYTPIIIISFIFIPLIITILLGFISVHRDYKILQIIAFLVISIVLILLLTLLGMAV